MTDNSPQAEPPASTDQPPQDAPCSEATQPDLFEFDAEELTEAAEPEEPIDPQAFAFTTDPSADHSETDERAGPPLTTIGETESGAAIAIAKPRRRRFAWLTRLAGHLIFSLLGLLIGYYILCWIDPRGNFLRLPLPGIPAHEPGIHLRL